MITPLSTVLDLEVRAPSRVREYAPVPESDYDVERFHRQCDRDLRERLRKERDDEPREVSAEPWFHEQQCPSDRWFGQ